MESTIQVFGNLITLTAREVEESKWLLMIAVGMEYGILQQLNIVRSLTLLPRKYIRTRVVDNDDILTTIRFPI